MDQQRDELIKNMEKENLPTTSAPRPAPKPIQKPPGFELSSKDSFGLANATRLANQLGSGPPGLSEW